MVCDDNLGTLGNCAQIVDSAAWGGDPLGLFMILLVAIIGGIIAFGVMLYLLFGRVKPARIPKETDLAKAAAEIGKQAEEARNDELVEIAGKGVGVEDYINEIANELENINNDGIRTAISDQLDKVREHRMVDLGIKIRQGAFAFMKREYCMLAIFVIIVSVVVGFVAGQTSGETFDVKTFIGFLVGALLSGACGWLGMYVAVLANIRTCMICWHGGLNEGLKLAFGAGAVMGLSVVSFGILGLCLMVGIFDPSSGNWSESSTAYLAGFGFGASSIALFARVGGGIYTKAADVGADLVGKVEANIPEDDPRNPATIADNVGDNVGDVAGMGADLFESFVGSIIAAIQLAPGVLKEVAEGTTEFSQYQADISALIALPFWMAGFGIMSSIIGIFLVRTSDPTEEQMNSPDFSDWMQHKLLGAINWAIRAAALISTILTFVTCGLLFGFQATITYQLWGCTIIGLVSGMCIGEFTEYSTSFAHKPTQSIAKKSRFGHAGSIIQGIGVGMITTSVPVAILFAAIIACYALGNMYGIAIAAVGMLSTLGVTLATDAFGPVADNAGGIAEMAELPERVRETTDGLDALGNTTAATGKGFAIGSAVLTSLALLAAFKKAAGINGIDVSKSTVLAAALFGACLPYIFAALTMMAVGRSAAMMIDEVRTQFQERNLLSPDPAKRGKPDCNKCIEISTTASLQEMVIPGFLAIIAPLFIGYLLNGEALGGMLVGGITSGCMLAIYMANAGGAWDNAKKWIEAGGLEKAYNKEKQAAGKGSEWHKASVTGDTVGDPFKDTSGPALNILIKLMTMIALVFGPTFAQKGSMAMGGQETCGGDGVYCFWWVGAIIGAVFILFAVGFWFWQRSTGFGKIDFDKQNTVRAEQVQLTEQNEV